MIKCTNCQADIPSELDSKCMYCGHDVIISDNDEFNDNKNDFENSQKSEHAEITLDENEISDKNSFNKPIIINNSEENLIGSSAPPPPNVDDVPDSLKRNYQESTDNISNTDKLKVLTDDDIKNIEKDFYSKSNYVSDKEKNDFLEKIEKKSPDNPNNKVNSIQKDTNIEFVKPKIAKKSKGIAYFFKNYIQIIGSHNLISGDEMVIHDREYVLKPKDISPKIMIGSIVGTLVIILISSGFYFLGGSPAGYGTIAGVTLDQNENLYLKGATVRLVELDESVTSNSQGYFEFSDVPLGPQKIEYLINGKVVKVDYATVSGSGVNFIFLSPDENQKQYAQTPVPTPAPIKKTTQPAQIVKSAPVKPQPKPEAVKPKQTKPKSSAVQYGKVTLDANVDGAKFVIDGNVMGAGNLTYNKIKAGSHNYVISYDGYKDSKGTFSVKAGENKKLNITLNPLQTAEKANTFNSDDYLYSAQNAYKAGQYKTAVADLDELIKKEPGNAQAFYYRGLSYQQMKNNEMAHDDLLKAAEIYQFGKKYNMAITSYNTAIEANSKSIPAYLGRGKLYFKKGEPRAAIADFDKVTKLDKRNYEAYFGLGQAAYKLQRFKKAVRHFKDARSINKKDPMVHQYLMLSYMSVNDFKNVKKSFDKFSDFASEDQMMNFVTNRKYAAVVKIINMKN